MFIDSYEFQNSFTGIASNTWFPITLSSLYIPTATARVAQLVEDHWSNLQSISSFEVLQAFAQIPALTH